MLLAISQKLSVLLQVSSNRPPQLSSQPGPALQSISLTLLHGSLTVLHGEVGAGQLLLLCNTQPYAPGVSSDASCLDVQMHR